MTQTPDQDSSPASAPDPQTRIALSVLEDFVVTQLLRQGRALNHAELAGAADSFTLSRAALRDSMRDSTRVTFQNREYDLELRARRRALPREEKLRQPLEAAIDELLRTYAKPLPVPVIARELALTRGALPETMREPAQNALRAANFALETAPNTYVHRAFSLDTSAKPELVARTNKLETVPEFPLLAHLPNASGDLKARATTLLNAAPAPLPMKLLGFALWHQSPDDFDAQQLARALGDRDAFYFLVGGLVTTKTAMEKWNGLAQEWVSNVSGAQVENLDLVALFRARPATARGAVPEPTVTLSPTELAEVRKLSRGMQVIFVPSAVVDALEIEPDDSRFVPTLQALNDTLRRDPEFLPVGIGRYLLRSNVPAYVGQVPQELRPVTLDVRDPETNDPLDFEMSDDGLEGDCAEFVHAPEWEDVSEEVEVRIPRVLEDYDPNACRYVVLNHHLRAGTMKLRRQDEEFWGVSSSLTRLSISTEDGASLGLWASRDSGLIYGLQEYLPSRVPPSGAALEFSRTGNSFRLKLAEPESSALVEQERADDLISLRDSARYLSLFELMQTVMAAHDFIEVSTLWAEVNVVRRTSKRLLCSVLSAYSCYSFKQRGPKSFIWRFDASRVEQGFKKNKRKFVRR